MANEEYSSAGDKEREAFPTHVSLDIPAESETIQLRLLGRVRPQVRDKKKNIYDPSEREVSPTHVSLYIPAESGRTWRILYRVPPQVREKNKHFYEPSVVSIGPYHYGQPQVRPFEAFKDEVLKIMLNSDGGADKGMEGHLRSKILERVDEIRSFYGWLSKDEYNDEALVEMMLHDACFVLYNMEIVAGNRKRSNHLIQSIGRLVLSLMAGDLYMLENQIPWWIIKLLISLKYDDEGRALICKFFSCLTFADPSRLEQVPWKEGTEEEPLHLLEAVRTTNLKPKESNGVSSSCPNRSKLPKKMKRPFRSATELKAKGIHFRPSSYFLNDVSFTSYFFWGVLYLPVQDVNKETMAFYSNIIVLETSPGNTSQEYAVTSYVNFIKSLVESPKDVTILQENGILINHLGDNEQVVRTFKEIDTHGIDSSYIFKDIKFRIYKHCDSKAKTWIAELINTYFRNPWTATALFAAAGLLCLTFLQTYYTMNPRNSGNN